MSVLVNLLLSSNTGAEAGPFSVGTKGSQGAGASKSLPHKTSTAARPVITALQPDYWEVGVPNPLNGRPSEPVELTVVGKQFSSGCRVYWNSHAISTRFLARDRLSAMVPYAWIEKVRPATPIRGPQGATGIVQISVRDSHKRASRRLPFKVIFVVVGG